MWPVIAGAALLGGVGNLIANQSQARAINEKVRRAQALAAEGLIDSGELDQRLHSIDRMFNQRLTSVLNTTALRSRGYANSGTIGAAAAGGVEAGRLMARSDTIGGAQELNAQVYQNIAQIGLQSVEADPIGSFLTGAVQGAGAGIQAVNAINAGNIDVPETTPGSDIQPPTVPTGDNIDAGFGSYNKTGFYKTGLGTWQSPLAALSQIDDEDLYNFRLPTLSNLNSPWLPPPGLQLNWRKK